MQTPDQNLLERVRKEDRKAQLELYRLCFPVLVAPVRRSHTHQDEQVSLVNNAYLKTIKG